MRRTRYRLRVPFREPYRTATGTVESWELQVLRIEEDGIVAWGEGDAAGEMALLDLEARRAGRPLAGPGAATVPVNMTLPAGPVGAVARAAADGAAAGFGCFKVKVGFEDDLERVAAVREAIGPDRLIRLDANAGWSAEGAIERLDRIGGLGIDLIEQPCPTLEELAEVRRATGVPVAADEGVRSVADLEAAAQLGACDLVCVKLAPMGVVAARAVITAARAYGIEPYIASLLDGPWGIAAALQVAAAEGIERHCGLATLDLFDSPLAHVLATPECGRMAVPPGPGIGVDTEPSILSELIVEELTDEA